MTTVDKDAIKFNLNAVIYFELKNVLRWFHRQILIIIYLQQGGNISKEAYAIVP